MTGNDWRLRELQQRYGDHWVPIALHKVAIDRFPGAVQDTIHLTDG